MLYSALGMKAVVFSPHSYIRLKERRISQEEIVRVIRVPDKRIPARRGRMRAIKRCGQHELHVFYRETPRALIVVTVYWR